MKKGISPVTDWSVVVVVVVVFKAKKKQQQQTCTVKIQLSTQGANLVFGHGGGALIGDGALIFFF